KKGLMKNGALSRGLSKAQVRMSASVDSGLRAKRVVGPPLARPGPFKAGGAISPAPPFRHIRYRRFPLVSNVRIDGESLGGGDRACQRRFLHLLSTAAQAEPPRVTHREPVRAMTGFLLGDG